MEKILLIGGGGHCKSCIEVIESTGKYEIVGIIDAPEKVDEQICGYKIIGHDDMLSEFHPEVPNALITVGQIKSSALRRKLFVLAKEIGFNLPTIVASTARVSKHAKVGEGSIIMHQAFVNADAHIGENCIVNSKALVEHDAKLGDFCHLSTNATLNGDVEVGNDCFIGSNTCVNHGVQICDSVVVGSNASVTKSIKKPGTYFEVNPLKYLK
jgi:sugar O-acyltransferase (sialic acid O-acetyltransferase NeuD family)